MAGASLVVHGIPQIWVKKWSAGASAPLNQDEFASTGYTQLLTPTHDGVTETDSFNVAELDVPELGGIIHAVDNGGRKFEIEATFIDADPLLLQYILPRSQYTVGTTGATDAPHEIVVGGVYAELAWWHLAIVGQDRGGMQMLVWYPKVTPITKLNRQYQLKDITRTPAKWLAVIDTTVTAGEQLRQQYRQAEIDS